MPQSPIPIVNKTLELSECRDAWFFDEQHQVWWRDWQ